MKFAETVEIEKVSVPRYQSGSSAGLRHQGIGPIPPKSTH